MERRDIDVEQVAGRSAMWLRFGQPRHAVFLIGALIILLIVAGAVLIAHELRSREVRSARRELTTLNTVLAEEASRAFQSVDLVLTSIVDGFKAENHATPDEFRRAKSGEDSSNLLRNKLGGLPLLDAITLVGVDGRLINFSRFYPVPQVDVTDRDYYLALSRSDAPEPFLSQPVENRGTGTWTIYLARRVVGQGGVLLGFVLGAIDLQYFGDFYHTLNLQTGSAISIWRRDGTLLARYPEVPTIGRTYVTPAFKDGRPENEALVFESDSGTEGESRLIARRPVPGYPLVVVVANTMGNVLADWRNQVILTSGTSGLAIVAVLLVMAAILRQFGTYEALARATREREQAIAAREQAEARLRQSQKLEAMGQLTSGVAHDFNNFLTVVIGNLEMILRRLPPEDPVRRLAEGAHAGAARAAALTKRLLAFSRRQEFDPQAVDVDELCAGLADLLRQTLGAKVTLRLERATDLWPAFIDANQLESALLNLVVNARDAMPEGGCVTIRTRNLPATELEPARIMLTVADTGTGMSDEVMAKAFEPFFTTKEAGRGTGLGLAQVHDFVLQCSGDVKIESVAGGGTSVHLLLPAHIAPPARTNSRDGTGSEPVPVATPAI